VARAVIGIDSGASTSVGRVRDHNEDDYVAEAPVFAVADGMGGHAGGEVAAAIAITELRTLVPLTRIQPPQVSEVIDRANRRILTGAQQPGAAVGMGTTLAGLAAGETAGSDHWIVFNVGDSRVYRWHAGTLVQLSTDHSEVQEFVAAGQLSPDEARTHPRRNIVTRSLGTTPPPRPDQWLLPPTLGERFLICSDGLPDELTDDEIEVSMSGSGTAQAIADELVERAVSAGGRDNVTAVVVVVTALSDSSADEDTVPRSMLGGAT
jgi:serine/threonine protein phosphatase PrpC